MNVFGVGLPEMAVIGAVALLVFGPKRLPELGKTLGKTLKGFQSASKEFEREINKAMAELLSDHNRSSPRRMLFIALLFGRRQSLWLSHRLIDFTLELLGGRLKPLQGFAECFAELGQALRPKNQKCHGADHRHLGKADAEHIHGF